MTHDASLGAGLVAALPALKAYARSLTRDADAADDLVQETALKAWAARHQFSPGTKLEAWLFTILRNSFIGGHRRRRHEVDDPDGVFADRMEIPAPQEAVVVRLSLQYALDRLSSEQREVLMLLGGEGHSYAEAAERAGVVTGTIKSRVHRARHQLSALMG
ncbi:sigma-70 family RNA polymerase sigma factor [Salinarimonas soli]|uniref:Sigma-70 family RNA polymerase sigma factor n=1 Tax=Salinarimonas soli TaxID=1638099 RepID=A0A5B2VI00_9HYPH|nr:sigma-70 family RNA polymerase sigma factor [Salinarimonas soli]KAA2238248.1 sigma-70 family RNA polymerase sigma factor [Salinarimonas soli]